MKNQIHSLLLLAPLAIGLMHLSSCSSAQNLNDAQEEIAQRDSVAVVQSPVVESLVDLPDCDSTNWNTLYFVMEDSSFQYCTEEGYLDYSLASPQQLVSSCSVKNNSNGSKTISCTDGTSATLTNGADGEDGQDGSNGSNGTNGSNGLDGKNGSNGTNGQNGSAGAMGSSGSNGTNGTNGTDGKPCTLSDDGFGTVTMTCGTTTKSWPLAICDLNQNVNGGELAKPLMQTALFDPMQIPYDPSTQICLPGAVVLGSCGEQLYDVLTEFCDTRDEQVYPFTLIGEKAWMTNNLNYQQASSSNSSSSGYVYTWTEATATPALCPAGWSMPSTSDLEALVSNLDGNAFPLFANPMGYYPAGSNTATDAGVAAYFWTSVSATGSNALSLRIEYPEDEGAQDILNYETSLPKVDKLGVRCVRDAREIEIKYFEALEFLPF